MDMGNSRALMSGPEELESQLGSIGPFSLAFLFFSPTYPAILYPHTTQSLPAWNHPDLVSHATLRGRMGVSVLPIADPFFGLY